MLNYCANIVWPSHKQTDLTLCLADFFLYSMIVIHGKSYDLSSLTAGQIFVGDSSFQGIHQSEM
jgi:hypothetical protein